MKLTAAVALACGFVAAPMMTAGTGSATPASCDGADCVAYVNRSAVLGQPCVPSTRYNFGLDPSGNTLACGSEREWIPSAPLVGIRTLRSLCGEDTGVAQSPDGVPLSCIGGAWSADYRATFYGEA
jgi:hypothetical protein